MQEAEDLTGALRREHDPSAAAGVPAHVTVVVPFLDPGHLDAGVISHLRELVAAMDPFAFRLVGVRWFGRSVIYLAPEPAELFVAMTETMTKEFGTLPYEGEYDDIVPHVTVAHASDGVELAGLVEQLTPGLPLDCRAESVWLMESDGDLWLRRERFVLGVG